MRAKAALLIGGVVGYVLGTRAGREQFDKLHDQAQRLWENPRVHETVTDVEQRANDLIQDRYPDLKEKVTAAIRTATDTVRSKIDEAKSSCCSGNDNPCCNDNDSSCCNDTAD